MNVFETILIFAVIPLAIYGVVGLLTLRSKFASRPRYRPGQPWEYPPVWWTANPEGVGERPHAATSAGSSSTAAPAGAATTRGGARGNW